MQNKNVFRILRIVREIKASELANKLDISAATISSIENGRFSPGRRLLRDYAKALDVTPEFISEYVEIAKNEDCRYEEYFFQVLTAVIEMDMDKKNT